MGEASTAVKLLAEYGPWAGCVFLGLAFWLERSAHHKTKDKHLDRALEIQEKNITAMQQINAVLNSVKDLILSGGK